MNRIASLWLLAVFSFVVVIGGAVATAGQADTRNGVVVLTSQYSVDETVARIKADVAKKGIKLFADIDQSSLGNAAGNMVRPSRLVLFGNPALGTTFITANPLSGLDWPVRVLVFQSEDGSVHIAYTDFDWISHRYGIENRKMQFRMASDVIKSVTSTVTP